MAKIGATTRGGVHRLPFSEEDTASRRVFLSWANARGFSAEMDDFGNIFVHRAGLERTALPVTSGSHSDTQPFAGRFDGIFGVLAALEVLEALEDARMETKRPVEAVIWSAEEADARFGIGCLGSQIYADPSKHAHLLSLKGDDGITVEEALNFMLANHPKLAKRAFRSPMSCYIEAHIEQGPELEASKTGIGIVTAIHGQRWFKVEIFGEAGHAGNTPKRLRKDALASAVQIISKLRILFRDPADVVRFTIGKMDVAPNALAVIPAYVAFTIDFRHPEDDVLTELGDQIEALAQTNAAPCEVMVTEIRRTKPKPFIGLVREEILAATSRLGYPYLHLPSGAGHDARYMADLCPTGMIFIPCRRGISHNELEDANPQDVVAGTRVLAETVVQLANL